MRPVRDITIEASILRWREALRLTDWDVRYDPDHTLMDDDCTAQIDMDRHRKRATIRILPSVVGGQIERHVAHELFHLVFLDYADLTYHVLAKHGDSALGVMDFLDDEKERICETVAEALTGFPWEPLDEQGRKVHRPFVVDQSPSCKETADVG